MEKGSHGQLPLVRGRGERRSQVDREREIETETSAEGHIVRRRGHTGLVGMVSLC